MSFIVPEILNVLFPNQNKEKLALLIGSYLYAIPFDNFSGNSIKIEEFNQVVFKKGVDQIISEEWHLSEASVAGEFNSLINGFDVATDVVRYSNPINNVTAVKSFESVAVNNLECQNGCILMDVDVGDWIRRVAFTGGNYTIQGTTIMEAPVFYNDLK